METLARLFARGLEQAIVNRVFRADDGRWTKTRLLRGAAIIAPGNVYLRSANARFQMHASAAEWQRYETAAYRALYGSDAAGELPGRAIWTRHIEGESLRTAVTDAAMTAAGIEIARAHGTLVDDAPFSHGDLHLKNLLYDERGNEAHIIDFETPHDPHLSANERHADDLYVLILDLLGIGAAPALAARLCRAYGRRPVLAALEQRLHVEADFLPRALQIVRSNYLGRESLGRLLDAVRDGL